MKVIFVAGIHAVGKSSACKLLSSETGTPHYTASQIIREEKASAISEDSKLVTDVTENQRLLVQGVSRLLLNGNLLLDGHFTMRRKSDGGIEEIHVDVFSDLCIGGVVLFIDRPEEISKRMYLRDGMSLPVDTFHEHQEAEISHARHVASTLGLPLAVLQAFDTKGMAEALSGWTDIPT